MVTNPPFLGKNGQSELLRDFCNIHYDDGKSNLATCFIERCNSFTIKGGNYILVTPQNWFFQESYLNLRTEILKKQSINAVVLLGAHSFETISGEIVQVLLIIFSNIIPDINHTFFGLDVSMHNKIADLSNGIQNKDVLNINQSFQQKNPDQIIIIGDFVITKKLGDYVSIPQGLKTGDDSKYRREFWELFTIDNKDWKYYQSTPNKKSPYSGLHFVIDWKNNGQDMARLQGMSAWGQNGIAIAKMDKLPSSLYVGNIQDSNIYVVLPEKQGNLLSIWYFLRSNKFFEVCKIIVTIQPQINLNAN